MAFVEKGPPYLLLCWNWAVLRTGNGPGNWFIMVFCGFFTGMAQVLLSTGKANVKCEFFFVFRDFRTQEFFKNRSF